jgi:peptide/nickel transport system substrate-binding protein
MNRHYRVLAWLMVVAVALALAACAATEAPAPTEVPAATEAAPEATEAPAPTEEAQAEEEEELVVLRMGALQEPDCWNPYVCYFYWYFGHIVSEGFTEHGPASTGCEGRPRLAESWEASDEGRTWTIKLAEGAKFNDGTPVRAQEVVDFIDWFRNSESMAEWYAESLLMESIEVVDEYTLRYTTSEPLLNSPDYDWQWWYILPAYYWSALSEEEIFTDEYFPPLGTGPYEATDYAPGSYVIFDAREDYYRGKPPIDRAVYQIYANPDALVNALISGEIDLTTPWLPPEAFEALANAEGIGIEEKAPGQFTSVVFNLYGEGEQHPAILDPVVREAMDYAMDKEQFVDVVLLGHGLTCPTNWQCGPNYQDELNPDLDVTPYDPEMAKQLLDEAGYVDSDGDGIRETPDGQPLEFSLLYQSDIGLHITTADLLKQWLEQVGIAVNVEAMEFGTWFTTVLDDHAYDLALDTEVRDIDAASMDFWFSCWSAESGSAALNYAGWCNEEFDELVYEYWNSTDLEARWEPMWRAQEILNQERPMVILGGHNSFQAYRTDRFEFPMDTCDMDFGMFSAYGLMNTKVK